MTALFSFSCAWNLFTALWSFPSGRKARGPGLLAAAVRKGAALSGAPSRTSDRRLVEEARRGDEGFAELVRRYERMVHRAAYRLLGDADQAADAAQEVFLRVYRALPEFRGDSALSTWIYTITVNWCRNVLRARSVRGWGRTEPLEDPAAGERALLERLENPKARLPLREVEDALFAEEVRKALNRIPPEYREAVVLRDLEGLEYREVSALLGVEVGTVKSRLFRGRALLREALQAWL